MYNALHVNNPTPANWLFDNCNNFIYDVQIHGSQITAIMPMTMDGSNLFTCSQYNIPIVIYILSYTGRFLQIVVKPMV